MICQFLTVLFSDTRLHLGLDWPEAFQLDLASGDLGEVIVGLLDEPGFGAAAKDEGEPDGHLRRYAAFAVHQFRQRSAGDPKGSSCIGDGQA